MKKVLMTVGLMSGLLVFGACGSSTQQKAASETAAAETTKVVKTSQTAPSTASTQDPTASTSAVAQDDDVNTLDSSTVSETTRATTSETTRATQEATTSTTESEQSNSLPTTTAKSSSSEEKSGFVEGARSEKDQAIPADLVNEYRTIIAQAGMNGATYSKELLAHYYAAGVQSGDFKTLLQYVAQDQSTSYNDLLANYYRYNGQNSDGTSATLPAEMAQAYRDVIAKAGLDAGSFSDAELTNYYHESHLTGDYGTLLRLVARDRGLNADQLLATYEKSTKQ